MAVTLTWSIDKMITAPSLGGLTNVVKEVHWKCTGVDGDATHFSYGRVDFNDANGDAFTAYADLTEEQVIEWVKADLGTHVEFTENLVTKLVTDIKYPPKQESALPW